MYLSLCPTLHTKKQKGYRFHLLFVIIKPLMYNRTRKYGVGRWEKSYKYTISDIARIKGKSVEAVRMDKMRGKFNPDDLGSVVEYLSVGLVK